MAAVPAGRPPPRSDGSTYDRPALPCRIGRRPTLAQVAALRRLARLSDRGAATRHVRTWATTLKEALPIRASRRLDHRQHAGLDGVGQTRPSRNDASQIGRKIGARNRRVRTRHRCGAPLWAPRDRRVLKNLKGGPLADDCGRLQDESREPMLLTDRARVRVVGNRIRPVRAGRKIASERDRILAALSVIFPLSVCETRSIQPT